jgi:hypothetical protein
MLEKLTKNERFELRDVAAYIGKLPPLIGGRRGAIF